MAGVAAVWFGLAVEHDRQYSERPPDSDRQFLRQQRALLLQPAPQRGAGGEPDSAQLDSDDRLPQSTGIQPARGWNLRQSWAEFDLRSRLCQLGFFYHQE